MARAVYKYEIGPGVTEFQLPKDAQLLHGDFQKGRACVCVWALVEPSEIASETHQVLVVGTGHPVPEGRWRYLNTVLVDNGSFVFHVFERVW